jgi:hypothetical protein
MRALDERFGAAVLPVMTRRTVWGHSGFGLRVCGSLY